MGFLTPVTATKKELRNYAWLMAGALSLFGAIAWIRGGRTVSVYFFSVAGAFLLFGLVLPMALRPVYVVWMTLAQVLAWINTRLILSLFFYVVMTPVSLVMKMIGRDALRRKLDRSASSYWQARKTGKSAKESYEHLY